MTHSVEGELDLGRTPQCLDEDTVAAMAEGSLSAEARSRAVAHLATCSLCRGAVASVARALADPDVASAAREVDKRRRRRWRRYLIGIPLGSAAAAAVVLFFLVHASSDREAVTLRGPTHVVLPSVSADAQLAPEPRSPIGAVDRAGIFRWSSVEGADRYRFTLFEQAGSALFETNGPDTTALLPDSVQLRPGRTYLWKVEARTGFDRWSPSPLAEFSIGPRSPP